MNFNTRERYQATKKLMPVYILLSIINKVHYWTSRDHIEIDCKAYVRKASEKSLSFILDVLNILYFPSIYHVRTLPLTASHPL